jgi:hypothetical protein
VLPDKSGNPITLLEPPKDQDNAKVLVLLVLLTGRTFVPDLVLDQEPELLPLVLVLNS